ncbi:MAG: dTDP-4-dehydrorhamnose 3,5-epimerase family protein [Candidatus Methylomirabilales bacterium]
MTIHGVVLKPLRPLTDERGFLMEMLRSDEPLFEGFGQVYITGCRRGVAKGWHYHREQTDHFVCVAGAALVVLYDGREGSPTRGLVQEVHLVAPPSREPAPLLLKIPPLVLHGFTAEHGDEARIVNVPTLPYRHANPDEYRLPWDAAEVPYRWPAHVTRGG